MTVTSVGDGAGIKGDNGTDRRSSYERTWRRTPPELSADILERGIVLTGGGAMLRGLEELIEERTGINTMTADEPMTGSCYRNRTVC